MQNFTSAKTSINKNKLPSSTKKIEWKKFTGKKVLDFGGGKFDNLKDFLKVNFNIDLFIYDKFNRGNLENEIALNCSPALIICNNVLNVIDSIDVIQEISDTIQGYQVPYFISVYSGNNSRIGAKTGLDTYQRNEPIKDYLQYFPNSKIKKNLIFFE